MRNVIAVCAVLACGTVAASQEPADSSARSRPSIIIMLVDDMGWRDVDCYGSEWHETPNIDSLARQGVRFTDAYVNGPNCAPSRASLMTGRYTPRHGIYTVGSSARGKAIHRALIPITNTTVLADAEVTIAEVLRDAGYATAHIGKWHLGDDPTTQGFDVNVGGGRAGLPKSYISPYRNAALPDGPDGEYLTDRLTSEAVAYITDHKDAPFFLYMSYFAVHTPVQGRPDLVEKHAAKNPQRARRYAKYAAMVESVDQSVGRLLATLDDLGIAEDTIVIFLSDNGGHARFTSMTPLRGSKGMLYEGGIREPFIVSWPGRIAAGKVSGQSVIALDIFPTILEAAGVEAPNNVELDGVSLMSMMTGVGTLDREHLFWHFPCYLEANQASQGLWRTTPAGAIRSGRYKLIEFFEDGRRELYDLQADPGESRNLAEALPDTTERLGRALTEWRTRVNAPVPSTPNPKYVAPQSKATDSDASESEQDSPSRRETP